MIQKRKVRDWCKDCLFTPLTLNGEKCLQVRTEKAPTPLTCLQCLYERVLNFEVTKPSNYREPKTVEETKREMR